MQKLGLAIVILMLALIPSACAEAIIIDHTCTDLSQIPDEWIEEAKSDRHIAYQHTSHGSQLITGMNALKNFPPFGTKYKWSDDGSVGLDLDDYGIPGCLDLSQGDWIDENGVTPWVTATRNLLNNPANAHVNVIMWSWCSINGHNITRYLDNMELLVAEYPDVDFVFMTGHAEGQGEGGFIYAANQQIRQHCIDHDRILFDFADIESYDPDGNYYYDKQMWDDLDYNPGRTNNWGEEWCTANVGSELEQLTTGNGVAGYSGCGNCDHSGSAGSRKTINCVLKGRATWWMMARLAVEGPTISISPTSHDFGDKYEGETDNTTFEVRNSGTGTLTYSVSETCSWVDLHPTSGSSTGEHDTITVDIDTTGLSEGSHTCDISISSNDGSGTFTVRVNIVPKPDLMIIEKWLCWPDNCTICYTVTNIGTGTAPACHDTTLYVDGVEVTHDHVPVDLAPEESYIGCFDDYTWTYTPPSDNITVCADNSETIDELDETNNCVTNIWMCGDVAPPYGTITWTGDVMTLAYYKVGAPGYTIKSEWAGDVAPPYGTITWTGDVMTLAYYKVGAPGYEIHCCCESMPDGAYGAINPFHRISDSPLLRLPDDMRDWPPVVPPEPHEAVDADDPTAMVIYNCTTGVVIRIPSNDTTQQPVEPDLTSTMPYQGLLPPGIVPELCFYPMIGCQANLLLLLTGDSLDVLIYLKNTS